MSRGPNPLVLPRLFFTQTISSMYEHIRRGKFPDICCLCERAHSRLWVSWYRRQFSCERGRCVCALVKCWSVVQRCVGGGKLHGTEVGYTTYESFTIMRESSSNYFFFLSSSYLFVLLRSDLILCRLFVGTAFCTPTSSLAPPGPPAALAACFCKCTCVHSVWCALPHNLAAVRLCNIKSTSAGSRSDKTNRPWHFHVGRQMPAPPPPALASPQNAMPTPLSPYLSSSLLPNYILFHFEDVFLPTTCPACPQPDLSSPLIWSLILLLPGRVIRGAWLRLKACFMPYWSQLAPSYTLSPRQTDDHKWWYYVCGLSLVQQIVSAQA